MTSGEHRARVDLNAQEIALMCDALDNHEYWKLGYELPRNNGSVFLPGDLIGDDYLWDRREPTEEEREAIDEVRRSRALAARLSLLRTTDQQ